MIVKMDATAAQGSTVSLPLEDYSSGYVVQEIAGLDPVKATLVSSSFAQQDRAVFQSAKREARNIVVKVGLQANWAVETVRDLRTRLYDVFLPKSLVHMSFLTLDGLDVDIDGYVESFDAPLFVEEPVATISLMCFDSDFVDLNEVTVNGNTTSGSSTMDIAYAGDIDTGFILSVAVNRTMSGFTVYMQGSDGVTRSLDLQANLLAGDVVKISTVSGDKYAKLTRGGLESSILYGVSPASIWMGLDRGVNKIRVYATGAAVPYTLKYLNRYGGL